MSTSTRTGTSNSNSSLTRPHFDRAPSSPPHAPSTWRPDPRAIIRTTMLLSPLAVVSLLVLVLAHTMVTTTPRAPSTYSRADSTPSTPDTPPTLQQLLADVADALDAHAVPFWLMPGLGLLPTTAGAPRRALGRFAPWREGVDLGVNQSHMMAIVQAQTALQPRGIVCVESYFGLRVYPLQGHSDSRYDYNTPFVDLVYFRARDDHVVNFCCDCEGVTLGPCSKKTCGCLVCAAERRDMFPLRYVRIQGMRRRLPAPHNTEGLMLPHDLPDVHPALFYDATPSDNHW